MRDLQRTGSLSDIRVPTLALTGDQDAGTAPEVVSRIHERIPASRLHVIANCAHLSNINQIREFNGAVLEFFAAHGA